MFSPCRFHVLILATVLLAPVWHMIAQETGDPDLTDDFVRVEMRDRVRVALAAAATNAPWPSNLPSLDKLVRHPSYKIRWDINSIFYSLATDPGASSANRRQYVEFIADSLMDTNSLISDSANGWLLNFHPDDFTSNAVRRVKEKFRDGKSHGTILLMGMLDAKYCLDRIRPLLDQSLEPGEGESWSVVYGRATWHANLVAARNGDTDSIRKILDVAEKENQIHIRLTGVFPDLAYVRRPEVVEYLRAYLFSDKIIPENIDVPAIPYAQQAAYALGRMLKGFPFDEKVGFYPDTIAKCRKWMTEQKSWTFK